MSIGWRLGKCFKGEVYVDNWNNILDENIVKANINFAAIFVLDFECWKDYTIAQPRTFYSDVGIKNGELYCGEIEKYKKAVRLLDKNILCE